MNNIKKISSLQNPLVKKFLLLKEKSRERKKTGLFILEGMRELQLALKGNYLVKTILYNKNLTSAQRIEDIFAHSQWPELIEVSPLIYQKLAYRETTEGVLALVESKPHALNQIEFKTKKPLILVAEAPEKPGNIGALLRTADAANLDAVLISDPLGDIYNPNIIRSSVGCVFTNTIGMGSSQEIIDFLTENNISIFPASLEASKPYTEIDFTKAAAIVVGTESTGLTNIWFDRGHQNIIIPMNGHIDSMNVSVSAAILIFEAIRQRL